MSAIHVQWESYLLHFNQPILTSRGGMAEKKTWLLKLTGEFGEVYGECNYFPGLSMDRFGDFEDRLDWLVGELTKKLNTRAKDELKNIFDELIQSLTPYPAIICGLEMLFASFNTALTHRALKISQQDSNKDNPFHYTPVIYPSKFTKGDEGIPINGLVWMGSVDEMRLQLDKLFVGKFEVIKIKIAALSFEEELKLIEQIRERETKSSQESFSRLEIRLDANGGFENDSLEVILDKLERLAKFGIHSVEQPVIQNEEKLQQIIKYSPIKIALDETLIFQPNLDKLISTLHRLKPDYLILKPSLIGGFSRSEKLMEWANQHSLGWWVTSALESSVGLNAIAQWTYCVMDDETLNRGNVEVQGLGTGGIYQNNFPSNLIIKEGKLFYKHHNH